MSNRDWIYRSWHGPGSIRSGRNSLGEALGSVRPRRNHIADKGNQLRRLHLMEPDAIGATRYPFIGEGDDEVTRPEYKEGPSPDGEKLGRVFINAGQWFADVPEVAWGFHIGGYQPARKWLKDREGRSLSFEDVMHYQRISKILCETDRIMHEIELPL